MSQSPVLCENGRAVETQPYPLQTLPPVLREYLLSRRRAIKLELQEIEKLLDLKPKQT